MPSYISDVVAQNGFLSDVSYAFLSFLHAMYCYIFISIVTAATVLFYSSLTSA